MAILQILLEKLADPLRISVVTGVLSSSYFFCGNLGASYWGIIPAIQDPTNDLSVAEKVELWKFFYDRAKFHFGGSAVVSAISFSTGAYVTSSHSLRNLLLCAAFSSFVIVPFTVFAMIPLNNELSAMHKSGSLRTKATPLSDQAGLLEMQAIEKIERWRKLHRTRIAFGAAAWIVGLAAFVLCN